MPKIDKAIFKLPTRPSIAGRSSSITNAFIAAVMPIHAPVQQEIDKALVILGMTPENLSCAYCGGKKTEWDHLNPFVIDREPTGYFSSIYNLVPACGKCNQSKGNKKWEPWIRSKHATLPDLEKRIQHLKKYEEWGKLTPLIIRELVGKDEWQRYMELCANIIKLMHAAEKEARLIKAKLEAALKGISTQPTYK